MPMATYAIIETGGKQYKVAEGQSVEVEKLPVEPGAEVRIDRVLLLSRDGQVKVGRPTVEGATVVARAAGHGRRPQDSGVQVQAEEELPAAQGPPPGVYAAGRRKD